MSARTNGVALTCALVALAPVALSAQATVKTLEMKPIASVKGKDVYQAYCAACHGDDLKGHGPYSVGVKVPPPDLTTIALRNGGKFVEASVEHRINGWNRIPKSRTDVNARQNAIAAGDINADVEVMPLFGPIFARLYRQEIRDRQIRMANLIAYIKSKQVKDPPADAR